MVGTVEYFCVIKRGENIEGHEFLVDGNRARTSEKHMNGELGNILENIAYEVVGCVESPEGKCLCEYIEKRNLDF